MIPRLALPVLLGFFALTVPVTRADVSLFPLFSDNAVLQTSDHVPVWGKAAPGEAITVTLYPASYPVGWTSQSKDSTVVTTGTAAKTTATAGADGRWSVNLSMRDAGGPYQLVAAGAHNQVTADNVIFGEVWLCSGQSNMEWLLKNAAGGSEEVARSTNPMLRHFLVTKNTATAPVDTVQGRWEIAGPQTSGGFTAVGYYFGKTIQTVTGRAVGLVHSSWGGTPSEAWTSKEGFAASDDAELKAGAEKARANTAANQKFITDYKAWQTRAQRQDRDHSDVAAFTAPATEADGWHRITLPGLFAKAEGAALPDAGSVWVQRTVTVKRGGGSYSVSLALGDLHSGVEIYWNGKKVGAVDPTVPVPSYLRVNGPDVKAGDNLLALRIFEPDHGAGIASGPAKFQADTVDGAVPLAGPWLAKAEFALPAFTDEENAAPLRPPASVGLPNTASYLYDGMLAPLVPYALRGVIWYQGESNAGRAQQYREAFPLMIKDWRAHWGRGDIPFYWCQLANFQKRHEQPDDSGWAELRDAQTNTLRLPNTGEAILIDIGEEGDIHPKNKLDVGERLARIALAKDYGLTSTVWSGPVLDTMTVEADGAVRLKFKGADGGLTATPIPPTYRPRSLETETKPNVRNSPGGQLEGFAVCGQDHQWHWATAAEIDGADSVVVRCAEVPVPVAVRYAWGENPLCNLANGAGLPAGPFRTDDFPAISKGKY